MKRVLFVDDERRVLEGLRNVLRSKRNAWDMRFTASADEALALLEEKRADVVVTDMCMPGQDGAQLLATVKERYPESVRIILSGHTKLEAVIRAVPVAHQFLNKPLEPRRLISMVDRALELHALLNDPHLLELVCSMTDLPSRPAFFDRMMPLAVSTTVEQFVELVDDPSISARALELAAPCCGDHASSLVEIATNFGIATLETLLLSGALLTDRMRARGFDVGKAAASRVKGRPDTEYAFIAGVLHGIGAELMEAHGVVPEGNDDARVGGYLLARWGLPIPIVEAVAHHRGPVPLRAEKAVIQAVFAETRD